MPQRYDNPLQKQFVGSGIGPPRLPIPTTRSALGLRDTSSRHDYIQSEKDDVLCTASAIKSDFDNGDACDRPNIVAPDSTTSSANRVKKAEKKMTLFESQLHDINQVLLTRDTKINTKRETGSPKLRAMECHAGIPHFRDTMHELEEINDTIRELDQINQVLLVMNSRACNISLQSNKSLVEVADDNGSMTDNSSRHDEALSIKQEVGCRSMSVADIHQNTDVIKKEMEDVSLQHQTLPNCQDVSQQNRESEESPVVAVSYDKQTDSKLDRRDTQTVTEQVSVTASESIKTSTEEELDNSFNSSNEALSKETIDHHTLRDTNQQPFSVEVTASSAASRQSNDDAS